MYEGCLITKYVELGKSSINRIRREKMVLILVVVRRVLLPLASIMMKATTKNATIMTWKRNWNPKKSIIVLTSSIKGLI